MKAVWAILLRHWPERNQTFWGKQLELSWPPSWSHGRILWILQLFFGKLLRSNCPNLVFWIPKVDIFSYILDSVLSSSPTTIVCAGWRSVWTPRAWYRKLQLPYNKTPPHLMSPRGMSVLDSWPCNCHDLNFAKVIGVRVINFCSGVLLLEEGVLFRRLQSWFS